MTRRRLLVLDAYDAGLLRTLTATEAWDVLLLGLSEAWFRWLKPALPPASDRIRFIDAKTLAPDALERVRAFADSIDRLPDTPIRGRRLGDILETDLQSSWWYTELSEKGPYRSRWVHELYQLALVDQAIGAPPQHEEIVFATRQDWLAETAGRGHASGVPVRLVRIPGAKPAGPSFAARYWQRALGAAGGVLAVRAIGRLANWPVVSVSNASLAIFTFFPAWWAAPASAAASERFFPAPPEDSCFFAWINSPMRLWGARDAIRRVIADRRIVLLQRLVSWRSALVPLSPRLFFKASALIRQLTDAIKMTFSGFEVGPLVAAEMARSLSDGDWFQCPMLRDAARAAAASAPRRLVYRAEFQPAERALVGGVPQATQTAGFVHYPYGRNYLPVWDSRQPGPAGFLTPGEVGRQHLELAGVASSRVGLCGPQRHPALVRRLQSRRDRPALRRAFGVTDASPLFFVGVAIVEADTEALMGALNEALAGLGPCHLRFGTHPNRPGGDDAFQRAVGAFGPRASVMGLGVHLYDALEGSDAAILIGSTVAFEAMALDCMPVVFENPSTFAATSLVEFEDALFIVRDGGELRAALEAVCADAPAASRKREAWPAAVRRMLGDMTTPLPEQLRRALDELDGAAASR